MFIICSINFSVRTVLYVCMYVCIVPLKFNYNSQRRLQLEPKNSQAGQRAPKIGSTSTVSGSGCVNGENNMVLQWYLSITDTLGTT